MKKAIIIVLFLVVGVLVYFAVFNNNDNSNKIEVIKTIKDYDYKLYSNSTDIYKSYFDELEKELSKEEVNEEKYVELISKMFILDFYNLDNKITNLNIGGTCFVYDKILDNFKESAKDTIYKYVKSNVDGKRNQELPVVNDVEILSIDTGKFNYDKETDYKAYFVKASWSYEKDLGYESEKNLIFVHDNNKISLVEMS